jgi:hypothetical protein
MEPQMVQNPSFRDAIGQVMAILKGYVRQILLFGGGGLAVLVGISAFTSDPVTTFFWLLSYVGIVLTLVSVAVMLVTFRMARSIVPLALGVSATLGVATSALSLWLTSGYPTWTIVGISFGFGIVLGLFRSTRQMLFIDGDRVRARGTIWSLLLWGVVFSLNHAAAGIVGFMPTYGGIVLVFSAGVTAGENIGLIVRARRASRLFCTGGQSQQV